MPSAVSTPRNLLVELDVLVELRQNRAAHGFHLVVGAFLLASTAAVGYSLVARDQPRPSVALVPAGTMKGPGVTSENESVTTRSESVAGCEV